MMRRPRPHLPAWAKRPWAAVTAAVLVVLSVVLCARGGILSGVHMASGHAAARPAVRPDLPSSWNLLGLGDSITAGEGCPGCASFLQLYAREIARDTSVPVSTTNLGVGGWTSGDLLESLSGARPGDGEVRRADIVVVTIGANDFLPQLDTALRGGCGGVDGLGCFTDTLAHLRVHLTAILQRIRDLRGGAPTLLQVTGYWNVFLDGAVADQSYGPEFQGTSAALTQRVNEVIRTVTDSFGARYIDLYTPFKGQSGDGDDTALLAADGDHPSQVGHEQIADTLGRAGYAPLLASW